MHRLLVLTVLFAGVSVVVPTTMSAQVSPAKRYYDRDHRDYHTWDDHEDRAYRIYLGEHHQDYREFAQINAARQREYFRWRHEHPDNVIFKAEIR